MSQRRACIACSMTSSEIRVFQSIGEAGSVPAPIAVFKPASFPERGSVASFAMILFHSVVEIFLSQARTSAMFVLGASKKFG